jgi:hypothetical protein
MKKTELGIWNQEVGKSSDENSNEYRVGRRMRRPYIGKGEA